MFLLIFSKNDKHVFTLLVDGKSPKTKHKNAETLLLLFVISPLEGALTQYGSDLGTASIGGARSTRSMRKSVNNLKKFT